MTWYDIMTDLKLRCRLFSAASRTPRAPSSSLASLWGSFFASITGAGSRLFNRLPGWWLPVWLAPAMSIRQAKREEEGCSDVSNPCQTRHSVFGLSFINVSRYLLKKSLFTPCPRGMDNAHTGFYRVRHGALASACIQHQSLSRLSPFVHTPCLFFYLFNCKGSFLNL